MKRIITRVKLAVIVCGLGSIGITAAAQADNAGKVLICHGTASDSNPYVLISINVNGLAGHLDRTAPGLDQNKNPDYLLPAGSTDCSGSESASE